MGTSSEGPEGFDSVTGPEGVLERVNAEPGEGATFTLQLPGVVHP